MWHILALAVRISTVKISTSLHVNSCSGSVPDSDDVPSWPPAPKGLTF